MDRGFDSKYSSSQDHLIITLNEQIQAMMPLKQSYSSLQRYHIKLTNDLEVLLNEHKQFEDVYGKQIRELNFANQQCDIKKTKMIEQLRALQKEAAKINLERKNLMATNQTLASKSNLQSQHSLALQNRSRQLMDTIHKVQQNISFNRKLITQIQTEVKLKQSENNEIRHEIHRRSQINKKLQVSSDHLEEKIVKTGAANESTASQIRKIQQDINKSELGIRDELKKSKQLNEVYLKNKEQLCTLRHQKQYYSRLIESQLLCKEDLDISQSKLQNVIERRNYELARVKEDNENLKGKIRSLQQSQDKNCEQKASLSQYLAQLIKTNTLLLENMEKYCSEDRRVHKILNEKFQRLETVCNKVRKVGNSHLQLQEDKYNIMALQNKQNYQNFSKSCQNTGTSKSSKSKQYKNWINGTKC